MNTKTLLILSFLSIFFRINGQTVQTVDLSTGVSNSSGTLQAISALDDTWHIIMPTGAQQPAYVTSGCGAWANPSNGCGRWITSSITPVGGANMDIPNSAAGTPYFFEMSFTSASNCPVTNAVISINTVGADNVGGAVIVNGTSHALSLINDATGINNFTTLTTGISINVSGDIHPGVNTIRIRVSNPYNSAAPGGVSYVGLIMCGSLTINYNDALTSSFAANSTYCSNTPVTVNGSASSGCIDDHVWIIAECDASGNLIAGVPAWWSPFFPGAPGSYTFPSVASGGPNLQCGKYYKVKLAVQNSANPWADSTKVIHIACAPTANAGPDISLCPGTCQVIGTAVGTVKATTFSWTTTENGVITSLGNSQQITVCPYATTTYTLTVTNTLTGCSTSDNVTITIVPQAFDENLSSGIYNNTNGWIPFGIDDDTWKIRALPGFIVSGSHSSLPNAKVVSPYCGTWGCWAPIGSGGQWISVSADASGAPEVLVESQSGNPSYDNNYYFEAQFDLPMKYPNMRIEFTDYAVDNNIEVWLNSGILANNGTNSEYSLPSWDDAMFNTLHTPGTIATTQSHYVQGTNTVLVSVGNGGGMPMGSYSNGSYMGLLMTMHVKGECPMHHSMIIPEDEMEQERVSAGTFVYPNPSAGSFTISSEDQIISDISVRDALGRIIRNMEQLNSLSVNLSMENENKGIYFVEIKYKEHNSIVFKKIVLD
jgi:hypothetical protein